MSKSVEEYTQLQIAHDNVCAMYQRAEAELERAFSMLSMNGVPKDRTKTVSNGIDVLATRYEKALQALSIQQEADAKWLPISMLPNTGMKMFVVIAIDVQIGTSRYTSDPYCVWHTNGVFERWPHQYKPTHFKLLPETAMATPTDSEAKTSA